MPIDISIDREKDMVYRVIRGLVTTDEIVQSIEHTLNHADFHPGIKSLTDLREVIHQANIQDIKKIADFFYTIRRNSRVVKPL